ncbi:MAG TPA: thioesterase family protein [Vicinamibacterales bacterium]|nr:thioesterase family protein [Vicinamibacterales bacterium]
MVSEHRLRRRVQFYETDAAGIVHFSCFFRYMEEAEHALWRAAGLSIAPIDAEIGWPRVAASFDFHRPLRFEDEFDVLIRIVAIAEKTMRYLCLITKGDTEIASGTMTITCVSKRHQPLKSISIPPEIAARFQAAPEEPERP